MTTQLRVEADGHDIGPGWRYAHDSVTYDTSQSAACGGSGDSGSITGPSALGLLVQAADYTRRLDPVQISDKFEFGPFVCGVGGFAGQRQRVLALQGRSRRARGGRRPVPDQPLARRGALVLRATPRPEPTPGNELFLSVASNIVQAGAPVEATVLEYDGAGQSTPAEGVRIVGGGDAMTDANGTAMLTLRRRAGSSSAAFAASTSRPTGSACACGRTPKSECNAFIWGRVVGTDDDDRIAGTDQPERFIGRDGDDRITSRGDGVADTVRCGPGNDVARADALDRVARNCEKVRRA